MKEFLGIGHIALMQMSLMAMAFLTAIAMGYGFLGKKRGMSRHLIWGNATYMLFFYTVSIFIGKGVQGAYLAVAFLDLTAAIFWMMALNDAISESQPIKAYVALSVAHIAAAVVFHGIFSKLAIVRSVTSFFIVVVLAGSIYRLIRSKGAKELDTYGFTVFTLSLFTAFKTAMTAYRFLTMASETIDTGMSAITSVNLLTFISVMFAVWINFAIIFLNYDVLNLDMRKQSLRDHLTKLPNRRMIMNKIDDAIGIHLMGGVSFALVMLDLDHFKKVNDLYGHNIGDEVLVGFSEFLEGRTRSLDLAGRYGGEEFMLILQVDSIGQAKAMVDRLVSELRTLKFSSKGIGVTVSGGVVFVSEGEAAGDINSIISLADKRLYKAKSMGRDRIVYDDM